MTYAPKEVDLIIRGAQVVSPEQIIPASVAIAGEQIVAVGHDDCMPPARQEMRADGLFLLPGAIDSHVHFRDPGYPHKETWKTGSAAAACGGVTTVFEMPNTNPPTGTLEALALKLKEPADRHAGGAGAQAQGGRVVLCGLWHPRPVG